MSAFFRSRSLAKGIYLFVLGLLLAFAGMTSSAPLATQGILRPFQSSAAPVQGGEHLLKLDNAALASITSIEAPRIELPLEDGTSLLLNLRPFSITSPESYLMVNAGRVPTAVKQNTLLRGDIEGEPGSHAYLALSATGMVNGYIERASGHVLFLSTSLASLRAGDPAIQIGAADPFGELPEFAEFCAVSPGGSYRPREGRRLTSLLTNQGLRIINVAIEADQLYYEIFPNLAAAEAYIYQAMGAVSDVYERELACKMIVQRIRIWTNGPDQFGADDLGGFESWWLANENPAGINLVHLFSGRRDLSYGGVAFVGGFCGGVTFGISGYLNGAFPNPFGEPDLGNWDVIVIAHEMGHNMGTFHTHDGYSPTIDDCGNGIPSRGGIMSYCHTHPGYTTNTDIDFHRRIQTVINDAINTGACLDFDCNGNNVPDDIDISLSTSADINSNDIPDECEDCNGNLVLDPIDIAGGTPDINGNGIPDPCEPDCNANDLPDAYEVALGSVPDSNGNNIPDGCEPDCNGNAQLDWYDIESGLSTDYDRNVIPDECQDCNGNLLADWIDLGRPENIFVADRADYVREYHAATGVPIGNVANTASDPYDVTFGPDNLLYVASFNTDQILRVDPDAGTTSVFVTAGSGGLNGPAGLVFAPNGNLIVTGNLSNSVLEYNGTTGAFIRTIVSGGGLTGPHGILYGPSDNLYVTSANNSVRRYLYATGTFVNSFVSAGSGGLNSPRGLVFKPDGNLLVCSFGTDQVLEYSGATGAFVRTFNDAVVPTDAWGIRIGPNGNVFVMRGSGTIRLLEYVITPSGGGRYRRPLIRGDAGLPSPTGFAFRPVSAGRDCNGNGIVDTCDIVSGFSLDQNFSGVPDECEIGDTDGDGVVDAVDNCVAIFNPTQADIDTDGRGDLCDNCPSVANLGQEDSDLDGVGDACDPCTDTDNDGFGDPGYPANVCQTDNCPAIINQTQSDLDNDGAGDPCDPCPQDALNDADADGFCANLDNCPTVPNPGQQDANNDGIGDACCCVGIRGNINGDPQDRITVADLTFLVGYIFAGSQTILPCPSEANVNGDPGGSITVSDLTYLVNYLFGLGLTPPACP